MLVHFLSSGRTYGVSATFHLFVDVVGAIETSLVRVGGFWNGEPIDDVSLVALDDQGHVTARLAPRTFVTRDAYEEFAIDRVVSGWSTTAEAAYAEYERGMPCPC